MTFFISRVLGKGAANPSDPNPVAAEHVMNQMRENYPEKSIRWMRECPWIGPVEVPVSQIDFEDSAGWAASHQPGAVDRFARHIHHGTAHTNPAVLVKRPGHRKLMIIDGHHRTLAYKKLGLPVRAYVGLVSRDVGPWDETHSFQIHQGSSPENKNDDAAAGKWEFPGGHAESGETPIQTAQREWQEETGLTIPHGRVTGEWQSPNGYRGYVLTVDRESDVPVSGPRDEHWNPDDPQGERRESVAWWRPEDIEGNPAVREELRDSRSVMGALAQKRAKARMEAVYAQLRKNYPAHALEWVREVRWSGPHEVPVEDVDWSNRERWRSWHDPEKVRDKLKKIKKQLRKGEHGKPVVLAARPGMDKQRIVDGHHRSLGHLLSGGPVWAWTAHVPEDKGPWDVIHDRHQFDDGESETEKAKPKALKKLHKKVERRLEEARDAAAEEKDLAAKEERVTKREANYRHAKPGARRRCATCDRFVRQEGRCRLVEGHIEAEDVCDYWISGTTAKMGADAVLRHVPATLRGGVLNPKVLFKIGGPEGFIHGYICVRPPCGGPGDPDSGLNDPAAVQAALMNLQMKPAKNLKEGDVVGLPEEGRDTFWRVQAKPIKNPAEPGAIQLNLQEWGRDGHVLQHGRTLEVNAATGDQISQARPVAGYQPAQADANTGRVYHANGDHIGGYEQQGGHWKAYHTGTPFGDHRMSLQGNYSSAKEAANAVAIYHNLRLLDETLFRRPAEHVAWGAVLGAIRAFREGENEEAVSLINDAEKSVIDPSVGAHLAHLRDAIEHPAEAMTPPPYGAREETPHPEAAPAGTGEGVPPAPATGETPEIAAARARRDAAVAAALRAYEEALRPAAADYQWEQEQAAPALEAARAEGERVVAEAAQRLQNAADRLAAADKRLQEARAANWAATEDPAADTERAAAEMWDAQDHYDNMREAHVQAQEDMQDARDERGNIIADAEDMYEKAIRWARARLQVERENAEMDREQAINDAYAQADAAGVVDPGILADPAVRGRMKALRDAVASGVSSERRPDTEGNIADTRVVDYNNGTRAIRKRASAEDTKREYLASLVGHILRANAPAAVITHLDPAAGEGEVHMEFIPNAEVANWAPRLQQLDAGSSPTARQMRIMDQLIGVMDRHDQNWMIDQNSVPHPIDHGYSFWSHSGDYYGDPAHPPIVRSHETVGVGKQPWSHFLKDYGGMPWDISPHEISHWREQMQQIESEFRRLDMMREYRRMMAELEYWAKEAAAAP